MKKFYFTILVVLLAATAGFSQENGCTSKTTPNKDVVFYGIDYSLVRFAYVNDTPQELQNTLPAINNLLITEAKKYNVGKYMKRDVLETDVSYVNKIANELNRKTLIANGEYEINQDQVSELISKYPASEEKDAVGLVFFAEQMNKMNNKGSYIVTFFDLDTKEVLSTCRVYGKTGGFGLRNFWAATFYDVLKKWK